MAVSTSEQVKTGALTRTALFQMPYCTYFLQQTLQEVLFTTPTFERRGNWGKERSGNLLTSQIVSQIQTQMLWLQAQLQPHLEGWENVLIPISAWAHIFRQRSAHNHQGADRRAGPWPWLLAYHPGPPSPAVPSTPNHNSSTYPRHTFSVPPPPALSRRHRKPRKM